MRSISELEKWIELSSIPIALLICGSVAPEVRKPIEAVISRAYENVKIVGNKVRRLLYNDSSPLYCF